jgi:predicted transcriptional regulator
LAQKQRPPLTEAELRLMDVLWDKGHATVSEVCDSLPKQPSLAYNTVLTTMRILEDKGYLRHTKAAEGRAFIYRPVVRRETASRNAVQHLLRRFFGNSAGKLVLNLLENDELDEEELRRIRKLVKRNGTEAQ